MEEVVICKARPRGWQLRAKVLRGSLERLVGLLGTFEGDIGARPVILVRCNSIHTFGMRYGIDVAFIGEDGQVISSRRSMPPGRILRVSPASFVLERPRSPGPWPGEGESIWIATKRGTTTDLSGLRRRRTPCTR